MSVRFELRQQTEPAEPRITVWLELEDNSTRAVIYAHDGSDELPCRLASIDAGGITRARCVPESFGIRLSPNGWLFLNEAV